MSEPENIDVLIIGGGINGCGIFRDLSAQGVDCVLIERDDFCSGASAASSRLMHGGLKYLETGEFGLVREALVERNRLLANAPHYVSPLPTILPLRSHFSGIWPSVKRFFRFKAKMIDRGSLITRAGLLVYDTYGRRHKSMPFHRILNRKALQKLVTGMDSDIIAAGLYYEGQLTHAERLGLELLLDGEKLNPGSRAINHAHVIGTQGDCVTYQQGDSIQTVRPRIIVNAAGAWIDAVNHELGIKTALMGGSKGSHIIVEHRALYKALNGHMIYFGTADGRVNLCYPFMGRVLIGSTDIPVEDPDTARCDTQEVSYMLGTMREVFPDVDISEEHVRYRFCGVRPLPRADGDIGLVTRDHSIAEFTFGPSTPVLCLIGGKWTTFRSFSAEAAWRILAHLGKPRRTKTEDMAIGGGQDFPRNPADRTRWINRVADVSGLPAGRVGTLLRRYGTTAERIAMTCTEETMLRSLPDYSSEELGELCRSERVGTLADLLLRRTLIAMSGRLTAEVIEETAGIAAAALGWSDRRRVLEAVSVPLGEPAAYRQIDDAVTFKAHG
jgi:glycerol-3-phosphate dehydrogenase